MQVNLKIGQYLLDVNNPQASKIDLLAIERNLWTARRFSNCPAALLVRQHTALVAKLAHMLDPDPVIEQWCDHHDDHEGITGDMPGPLKNYLNHIGRGAITKIEDRLDVAICAARQIIYPSPETKARVHFFDKLAETIEWQFVLNEPEAVWNKPLHNWMGHRQAQELADWAMALKPPKGVFK